MSDIYKGEIEESSFETEKPRRTSILLLVREGLNTEFRYFPLLKRRGGHLDGFWELPGGEIDPGLSDLDGILRELEQETSISLAPTEVQLFSNRRRGRRPKSETKDNFRTTITYYAKINRSALPEIKLSEEHSKVLWIPFLEDYVDIKGSLPSPENNGVMLPLTPSTAVVIGDYAFASLVDDSADF